MGACALVCVCMRVCKHVCVFVCGCGDNSWEPVFSFLHVRLRDGLTVRLGNKEAS